MCKPQCAKVSFALGVTRLIRDQNKCIARFEKAAGGGGGARNQAHILWPERRLPFASLGIEDFFN
jgi:hypothetical protein